MHKQLKINETSTKYNLEKNNIIQYYYIVYISNETILKAKILRRCYDDSLTKYFDVKKTIALIQKKFF